VVCSYTNNCTNEDTCEGNWSPWANVERCPTMCGRAMRRQSRICYSVRKLIILKISDERINLPTEVCSETNY